MRRLFGSSRLALVALVPAVWGLASAALDPVWTGPAPIVRTTHGPVRGVREGGVQAFTAIPYAAPPVGDRRWRAPAPPQPWTEPLDATAAPPRCRQRTPVVPLPSSEDCLYLNVHAPDPLPDRAPVLVWIHGGGFVIGEGMQTDGATAGDVLARRHGMVVVSMNYRLGAYGFLAHEALRDADGSSGNHGLADQLAALRWVRDNIAAFGGDPDNVTLAGESAGGLSVVAHLASPRAEGLFHRAIIQSGMDDVPLAAQRDAERVGQAFAEALGCAGRQAAACMRGRSAGAVERAAALLDPADPAAVGPWRPTVDGSILPADLRERLALGRFARVPVLIGWNADEGSLLVRLHGMDEGLDEARYRQIVGRLARRNGVSPQRVLAQYPPGAEGELPSRLADAHGDAHLACPSRGLAELLADGGAEVRVYHFTYPDASFQLPWMQDLGAYHSAEIQYVFGHRSALIGSGFEGDDQRLHEMISGYWARFAATGDPNGSGAARWPRFDPAGDRYLRLDRRVEARAGADAGACAVWGS